MMINFSENFKRYRREAGINQDELASRMGVTPQAVSKWECGLSMPDVMLLVPLAELFGITVDELLRGEGTAEKVEVAPAETKPEAECRAELCDDSDILKDDDVVRIVMCVGKSVIRAEEAVKREPIVIKIEKEAKKDRNTDGWYTVNSEGKIELTVVGNAEVEGDINGPLTAGAYVTCGNVNGCANVGEGITCGNINGSANAGDGIICGNVNGSANAGDGITCGNVNGDVNAGDSVACGDVEGDVHANGDIECGDVEGDVVAQGSVECEDVEGDVAVANGNVTCGDIEGDVVAKGEVIVTGDIDGDVTAESVTCNTIDGDVKATTVTCDRIEGDVVCEGNDLVVTGTVEGDVTANNVTCQKIEGDVEAETVNYVQ